MNPPGNTTRSQLYIGNRMTNSQQEATSNIPRCAGFIMDGNRRWARKRNLPALAGHKAGYDKFVEVVGWAKEASVPYVIAYAFSTENWNRSDEEVGYLMDLFRRMAGEWKEKSKQENIRLRFIGARGKLPEDIQNIIADLEEGTKDNTAITVVLAVSYGGRGEIVDVINKLPKEKIGNMTEEEFEIYLWTAGIPDPDMIVRTSGEKRLSGFLPWQSVYAELFFLDTHWPAFTKEEFHKVLNEFAARERRRGR